MTSLAPIALLVALSAQGPAGRAPFEASFLYSLSTNFGPLPFSDAGLSYDPVHKEVYVTGEGPVRVFNDNGMEVYSFGESPEIGIVRSIDALEDGSLIAFVWRDGRDALVRLTFRGEYVEDIALRNVPRHLQGLRITMMRVVAGKIYLTDAADMRVLVLDKAGEYVTSYDIAEKLEVADQRADLGLRGFSVDLDGNMLFTIQPLFRAYIMTPDGVVKGFGQRGSAPGKFNIVGGIGRDEAGYIYVADLLKSAVLVFDAELRFVKEFGYRGRSPGSLAAPEEIVAFGGKVFVSNRGRKGVSVFRVGPKI